MLTSPTILQMARDAAQHASARQGVIARNIAHADTPGYRAHALPDFATTLRHRAGEGMRATRGGHLNGGALHDGADQGQRARPEAAPATVKPNGNTVSVEHEMMRAARARLDHDTALAAYASARSILRSSLGR